MKKGWRVLIFGLTVFLLSAGILFTIYPVKYMFSEPGYETGDSEYAHGTADIVDIADEDENDADAACMPPAFEGQADEGQVGEEQAVGGQESEKQAGEVQAGREEASGGQADAGQANGGQLGGGQAIEGQSAEKKDAEGQAAEREVVNELPLEDGGHLYEENSKINGKRLDASKLAGLNNEKRGWWVRFKVEHQPPVIDPVIQKMMDKYDGIFLGNTDEKVIYLTFDEGYENGYTLKILDILKENDVKAAFFITGSYMKRNKDLVRRMLDEGHIVGGHTITHPSLPDVNDSVLEKELYGFEKEFYSMFNEKIKYVRPPNGEYSERTLAATKLMGYKSVFWSITYRDFEVDKQKGADYAYQMVMDQLHNGAVILLHAVSRDNAEALDRIIKDIKAQGYEFRLLDL